MAFYPQINSNLIITQLPYATSQEWGNIVQAVETGIHWSFPLRGAGLSGYPTGPLFRFSINYVNITDAEINTLFSFFQSVRGCWQPFSLLDPSGNLLQFSETFSNAYWVKTSSLTSNQPDPLGYGQRATLATAGFFKAVVGPSSGGMSGFVMCASVWVKAQSNGTTVTLGFIDNSTSTQYTSSASLNAGNWTRLHFTLVLPTNNQFLFYLNLGGTCTIFGAQVAPMKGEGGYAATPNNYGYHQYCRFDTDDFIVNSPSPNSNQLALPVVEFNGA
jgi:hypothetical protein